jgi:hypothetical protein
MRKVRSGTARASSSRRPRKTSDALEIIDRFLIGNDRDMRRDVDRFTVNALVAQRIDTSRRGVPRSLTGDVGN